MFFPHHIFRKVYVVAIRIPQSILAHWMML